MSFRFDPRINFSHILTCIGIAGAALIGWGVMTAQLVHVKEVQIHQETKTEMVASRTNALEADSAAVKQSIIGIEKGIQDLRQDLRLQKGQASR
jgi:hypothetical protein